ncbi:MAG: SGNH/GDSL hydrolase family protein [Armatimonadetes bacterium]|nr:SGNH/GDSL hydrolase family protein [Armatimonadota bacterium]
MTMQRITLHTALALAVMSAGAQAETQWRDATEFDIEGQGWSAVESPYDRLPAAAKGKVPESVWYLSQDSAGLAVRFSTDAPSVMVRWKLLRESLAMPHMPATGVSGVDLYKRGPDGKWQFVANGRPEKFPDNEASFGLGSAPAGGHEMLLYLPLYNGVRRVEIGVPEGAKIAKAPPRPAVLGGSVVFYGTSIVQGGCASRPGLAHVAIAGRLLDRPALNLGFSGSGLMEPVVSGFLAQLDPACYVIDCLWNMGSLPEEEVVSRIGALVRAVRAAHPAVPILFVGQSHILPSAHPTKLSQWQRRAVEKLRASGVRRLFLLDGSRLMGGDAEGTVDGCHPNDLGMMRQGEAIARTVARILR